MESSVESINTKKLLEECYETKSGVTKVKTKTAFIPEKVDPESYTRKIMDPIQKLNRHETKVLILSRFHMLECGNNFKGTLPEICLECNVIDDEQHRLNYCTRFRTTNLCDNIEKLNFDDIYDSDISVVKKMLSEIDKVWNAKTGHGSMVHVI